MPDPSSRPVVEQLLFEMDQCGVAEAVLVAARIDHNPDNNDYVAECVRRFSPRLYQFADVDCMWTSTYHNPGAAERLAEAVHTYSLRGFTHYVDAADDGSWFISNDGQAFLGTAADLNQIVSIHLPVQLQPMLRRLAGQFADTSGTEFLRPFAELLEQSVAQRRRLEDATVEEHRARQRFRAALL